MYGEYSALGQIPPTIMQLGPGQTIDVNSKKLKILLDQFHCFPSEHRKAIWSYLLQLPGNADAFNQLLSKAQLPQARILCQMHKCGQKTLKIVNALIHWHAPLINCEWLPAFVGQLVRHFKTDLLFVFEVTVTFLTNCFQEWLSEVPGPPPEVLSRVDAIFANHNIELRNGLGTAFVSWPVYRSCFAEILYDNVWIQLMDNVFSACPQYLEYLSVAWLDVNGPMLLLDHSTFHSTKRAINLQILLTTAQQVEKETPDSLKSFIKFKPLSSPNYPYIEASSDAVVLRTLQSDHDKLATLQKQLQEERRKADEAEKVKLRKRQTYESIQKIHRAKEDEEKAETAKAAVELDSQMKRLRLEGRKLRLADERHFLEMWQNEWDVDIDTNIRGIKNQFSQKNETEEIYDSENARFESLKNLRQADLMARDARRVTIARTRQARNELEAQSHQRILQDEVRKLANNPTLLTNLSSIKTSKKQPEQ